MLLQNIVILCLCCAACAQDFIESKNSTEVNQSAELDNVTEVNQSTELENATELPNSSELDDSIEVKEGEKELSKNILAMLEHYKQPDPIGLPLSMIPDPYPVPDMHQSSAMGTMHFKNTNVYGVSKFRIDRIDVEIEDMKVHADLSIDALRALGNYTISAWFQSANGNFSVDITGLKVTAIASLAVQRNGTLRVQDIDLDLQCKTIYADFGDLSSLGIIGSMFQTVLKTGGTFLFDSMKPYIIKEAHAKAEVEINAKLEEFVGDVEFPNSIPPLDMVIIDLKKIIRDRQLDPYQIKNWNTTMGIFTVTLHDTWLTGVSSIHRVGNITLTMEENTLIADFEVGTQELEGTTQWDISSIADLVSKAGTASFSVEHITVRVILAQPLDTRKKPIFKDINIEIGNIQVRCNGLGTIDYVIEFVVNIIPNLVRYQIMDATEYFLKELIQKEFEKVDVEDMIKEKLPELEQIQETGLKLSDLKGKEQKGNYEDVDEFFDF